MWSKLQIFGFRALWSPYFLLFIIAIGIAYYLVTGPLKHKFGGKNEEEASVQQKVMFSSSLLLLYIVKGSPVDLLSHISLMAHMIQMAFYYLAFPILFIKGIPTWIWKKIFKTSGIKHVLNTLTKPLIAIFLFNFLFSIYHIPAILDFSKSHQLAHSSISLILLFCAFCMWWPLMTPIKDQQIMKPLYKVLYIFGNGILITPACALIIFSSFPIYDTYSDVQAWSTALSLCVPADVLGGLSLGGPELITKVSVLHDQQAGGIIMKVLQEIIYGAVLTTTFFKWYNSENRGIDPLPNQT
ncbi:cytochrome c oxidase assembly factor CtaG [Salinibacillus xinjiangensis]|uniref:Cytochrome c oxidase assembly factor CtaG n=1 Tax=Salinibacillus xinjiangensis TaxID=1229268 RepID=A0A6G1X3W9_9BACI|nr:cytochrome c oxidase assembly factor CtaG [Salinibacillus xinjiangensis]MRG85528.1 cytochrome c oxidase assembly factor CtaG [Salinibacillus xinjiangensis]